MLKFCCDCNDCGRLFQILADALEKARLPAKRFFDRREWSSNWILLLELRLYVEVFLMATMLFRVTGGVSRNAVETEHSNLEIDSKLNRQPVKMYKPRWDVFMTWQWAHQSDCRVLHLLLRFVAATPYNRLLQWSILGITIAWTIDFLFSKLRNLLMRPILWRW